MNETDKLYVLEKKWEYFSGINLEKDEPIECLIRPCNVSHDEYVNFMLGKQIKYFNVIHEGAVCIWDKQSNVKSCGPIRHDFATFEELMVYANVNLRIFPTIENWLIKDEYSWTTFYAKTIDLNANKTIYDNTQHILERMRKLSLG